MNIYNCKLHECMNGIIAQGQPDVCGAHVYHKEGTCHLMQCGSLAQRNKLYQALDTQQYLLYVELIVVLVFLWDLLTKIHHSMHPP